METQIVHYLRRSAYAQHLPVLQLYCEILDGGADMPIIFEDIYVPGPSLTGRLCLGVSVDFSCGPSTTGELRKPVRGGR